MAANATWRCPIDRTGNLRLGRTLTGEAIRQILARRTLAAGVGAISPHDLRRTYAGDLLDAGADLPAVQQLMGHASPSTTSRYDRRSPDRLQLSVTDASRNEEDRPEAQKCKRGHCVIYRVGGVIAPNRSDNEGHACENEESTPHDRI